MTKPLAGATQPKGSMILPGKTTKEVLRQLGLGSEVKVSLNGRQAAFFFSTDSDSLKEFFDGLYLVSKVEEGVYPNYKQVIPKQSDQRFEVDRELFLESVNRAEVVTNDKNSFRVRISWFGA
jgi:DNA polymerase-3 subunit beta